MAMWLLLQDPVHAGHVGDNIQQWSEELLQRSGL
jgi:hypothetical protein